MNIKNDLITILESGVWKLQASLSRFEGSAKAIERCYIPLLPDTVNASANFAGAEWQVTCDLRLDKKNPGAYDGVITFRVTEGEAKEVNAAVEFFINDWGHENFLMLPSAAYNGNRRPARNMEYPPNATDDEDISLNPPGAITDVPRLETDAETPSRLQILTGDETTPSINFYSPTHKYACIILTDQGGIYNKSFRNHGLHVLEDAGHNRALLRIDAPGVRPQCYHMMNTKAESPDRGVSVAKDREISIRFRLLRFAAESVQDLYDRFADVAKDLTGEAPLRHCLPFSAAWAIQESKYNEQNWNDDGYYAVDVKQRFSKPDVGARYSNWQLGWVGGGMATFPLLFQGSQLSRERALVNLEWLFAKGQLPCGLFAPIFHHGKIYSDNFADPENSSWAMVRKEADALYFLMKHFALLAKQDCKWKLPDNWEDGTKKLCDLFCAIFEKHGQLGQLLDMNTGEIIVGGSTAAAMAPAGLALASELFHEPRYLAAAEKMAQMLFNRDARTGVTTGGPGEILQCPDSESAFAMLESLVVLHEVSGKAEWLEMAAKMARQCLTWCATYDYRFPPESDFGKLDMRAAGSVWANVQNKHSAPGICTLSGDSLFKLWRATGNNIYLDLIRLTAHNLTQYLSRADQPVGDPAIMKPGWMCERVNFSDWEGQNNVGGSLFGSCWCEVSLSLTTVEIPGLYVQPDSGFFCAFDHVDVELLEKSHDGVKMRLSNPTAFDASVRVLAEKSSRTERALGQAALWGTPIVKISAGANALIQISSDCRIAEI